MEGRYVLFYNEHFVGFRVLEGECQVNFTRRTHLWEEAALSFSRRQPLWFDDETNSWAINGSMVVDVADSPDNFSAAADALGGTDSLISDTKRRLHESRCSALARKARRVALMQLDEVAKVIRPHMLAATDRAFVSLENFSAASRWDVDVLRLLHPHPRDFQIRFEEEGHRYFLGGAQCRGSVTALIHAFSHLFNSDEVIAKMRCSTNWPRAGYLRDPIPTERLSRLSVAEPALCALLFGSPRNDALICSLLQRLRALPHLEQDVLDLAMSDDDLKIRWAANGAEAARYGTWMHWLFDAYLNGHVVPTASQELRMMQSFLREELADVEVWRTGEGEGEGERTQL